jgi:hypothetical protein
MSAESLGLRASGRGADAAVRGRGNTGSRTSAGFITIPGGAVILVAFGLARRAFSKKVENVATPWDCSPCVNSERSTSHSPFTNEDG